MWLPSIAEFAIEKVKKEVAPIIKAEVSADLFPRLVTLTLSVLGMLSLIAAIIALILGSFQTETQIFTGIDWPGTLATVALVIGIITLISFTFLFFEQIRMFSKSFLKIFIKPFKNITDKRSIELRKLSELRKKEDEIEYIKKQFETLKNLEKSVEDLQKLVGSSKLSKDSKKE